MSTESESGKLTIEQLAQQIPQELVPLNRVFSYFTALSYNEEEIRQFVHEPVAALPAAICDALPNVRVILVPYLERANGRGELVSYEKPVRSRQIFATRRQNAKGEVLLFATKDEDVADYHYSFYNQIAILAAERWTGETQSRFGQVLREELINQVNGEVDEKSWHLKQALLRRQKNVRRETKLFREYARQAFEDTLTLYLHGICCDIDVETGPRQLPSRHLRRRLELLQSLFPQPEGYAVFPEQLKSR